jgi:ABC-2 type transport system permease protein
MKTLLQLVRREFGLFWQNKVRVVIFFVMSLVLAAVIGFVYQKGKVKQQTILVIDKDHSPSSARLIDMLDDHEILNIKETAFETTGLQQMLLDKNASAVIVIPYRFEEDILRGRKAEINTYLNTTNVLVTNVVGAAIQNCVAAMNAGIAINVLQKKGIPHSLAPERYEAFHYNTYLQYNRSSNYLLYLWPGLILGTFQQLLLLATAVGFSQEVSNNTFNKEGLFRYSRSAPTLFFVKIFPYVFMSLWILTGDYLIACHFKILPPSNPGLLLVSAILFLLGTCAMGTLFSLLFPLPLKASQTLMSFASTAPTLSGLTWKG